jgi:hypothetical protein
VAEVQDDDDVMVRQLLAQGLADEGVVALLQVAVVDVVDLEQLAEEVLLDIAPLDDGGRAVAAHEGAAHGRVQARFEEVVVRRPVAEHADNGHLVGEVGDVVGGRQDAAGEALQGQGADGQRRLLGRLADGLAVVVLVDDGLADEEDLQRPDALDDADHRVGAEAAREAGEVLAQPLGQDAEVAVGQGRGAKGQVVGEGQPPADGADGLLLQRDGADPVVLLLELGPLDEDVGAERLDGLDGHGPLVDDHEIDALQGGDGLGPQLLGEDRAERSLVDEAVGGDGDDEDVAELPRLLEVADVADVQRVEDAVA